MTILWLGLGFYPVLFSFFPLEKEREEENRKPRLASLRPDLFTSFFIFHFLNKEQ